MRRSILFFSLLSIFCRITPSAAGLAAPAEIAGIQSRGTLIARETVAEIEARSRDQARDPAPAAEEGEEQESTDRSQKPQAPDSRAATGYPEALPVRLTAIRGAVAVGTSFLAVQTSETVTPPDAMGDVGPAQILVCVNGRIKVFDKLGNLGALNTTTNSFFSNNLPSGQNTVDPRARYDRLSGRWFITMMTRSSAPNYILIAVSNSSTITSATVFSFFRFEQDLPAPSGDTGRYADYATLGVDNQALYIGVNYRTASGNQSGAYLGDSTVFVLNKADLVNGLASPRITAFRDIATATVEGPQVPHGVSNDDPAAAQGYFIGIDNMFAGKLVIRRVSNPGSSTPTLSGNLFLTTQTTSPPTDVLALGSSCPLWALDGRLLSARMHRGSLWTVHQIQVNASGVASGSGGRDGARWYQIGNLTTTPTLIQSGTLFDSSASSPRSYFYASCAANGQGHMTLATTVAGANEHAEIAAAQRFTGDPLGTLQPPVVVQASGAAYNLETCSTSIPFQQWGHYSVTTVDPTDDMTFWTFQEYANATNSWGVRVVQIKVPPPASAASANPASVAKGQAAVDVVVTGTTSSGSGFFDPGSDYPNHISATVDGGVTVNSVTYTDPTHITLHLSTVGATVGTHTVTVTNPDGQRMTGAAGILTVTLCTPGTVMLQPSGDCCVDGTVERNHYQCSADGMSWVFTGTSCSTKLCGPIVP
jgi:hypothetical protein